MTTVDPILKPLGDMLAREELQARLETPGAELLVTVCAWCQKEQGLKPQPNQSHSVCAGHKAIFLKQLEQLQHIR
jgi:hypothetical protein